MQEGYRRCSCYPGYIRPSNNSCQGESLSCFKDVLYDLGNSKKNIETNIFIFTLGQFRTIIDGGKEKTCMSACVDQTFDATVSSNSFPSRESFNHRKFFCRVVRRVLFLFQHSAHQIFLGNCLGSHAVTNIHLKLLKNNIQICVMRLSIFLASMGVIKMEIGLLVKFQQINQDGKILNKASCGNRF